MIYILGGAPRSGKSIISRKLCKEKGIPYFCIDVLITSLQEGVPELGIKHGLPFEPKAESLWPRVKPLLKELIKSEPEYLVEGDGILPKHVYELSKEYENTKSCFCGFTSISVVDKLNQIKSYQHQDDWTKEHTDRELKGFIEEMVDYSRYLKYECEKYEIRYFDCSNKFEKYLDEVYRYLAS